MPILHAPPDPFACLYVIEINGRHLDHDRRRIKVGYTTQPEVRLAFHREMAEAFGATPGRQYVSPPGSGSRALEAALIAWCASRPWAKQYRREYFVGVAFGLAARKAARLCGDHTNLLVSELVHPDR